MSEIKKNRFELSFYFKQITKLIPKKPLTCLVNILSKFSEKEWNATRYLVVIYWIYWPLSEFYYEI